ncbi:MAG: ParB N-terminal domain-containing protein, partial [Lachnospiraceae bacterium]|nr:ParB N-terminal domain-containing protein [Lachnospiraceae bacterium]
IIVKDRIRKDFGDISELAQDIKENGLINPPVVIPEENGTFTLLAGERRIRAMKQLGYPQVEVRTWKTLTEEEKLNVEISENEVRKEFSKAERVEYGRRLERIEREKAKERQGTRTDLTSEKIFPEVTRPNDVVAEKLGIGSGKQYEHEKAIVDNRDLISAEDFANWDEGKLSTNKVYQQIKAELNRQKAENERLRNRPPETKTVVREVQVVPDDYESAKREARQLNTEYHRMAEKWQKADAERQALLKEKESAQNQETEHLRTTALAFNAGIANFIERYGGYVWLTEHVDEIPDRERNGFISGLNALEAWVYQMQENITKPKRKELL